MKLIRTSFLNAIAVIVRILTLLGLNKILAFYVGPTGYAIIGQFQNAVQIITGFTNSAITTGVTKYTAEYDEKEQRLLWQTAGMLALIGSVITAFIVIRFNRFLAAWFFKEESLGFVFICFAATLVFFVFNTLFLSILNGKKEIGRYVLANIAGSLFSLLITSFMTKQLGLSGALIGLAIYQSLTFFVTFLVCYKTSWFQIGFIFGKIQPRIAKALSKYAIMALVTATCAPITQILIRNYLGNKLGWIAAGYWEAMWRLSTAYLMLVTTTLALYYLPKLSELKSNKKIREEIINIYKVVLPATLLCSLGIYVFRDNIISLLFTQNFMAMQELFAWQMIGDSLKIASWILGYVYVAKGFFHLYVISEILFSLTFFGLVVLLESSFHLKAVALAHALNYLMHFAFVFISLKLMRII